ncbi:hypothetical protein Drorol1_Dr00000757 [Drosera rotundifolia]
MYKRFTDNFVPTSLFGPRKVIIPSNFADFHAYAFSYNLTDNERQRYIDIGTICVLLPLVLGPYFPLEVNALVEYLQVRDIYQSGEYLVVVTTDRQSAFDRVLASIPFKGQAFLDTRLEELPKPLENGQITH